MGSCSPVESQWLLRKGCWEEAGNPRRLSGTKGGFSKSKESHARTILSADLTLQTLMQQVAATAYKARENLEREMTKAAGKRAQRIQRNHAHTPLETSTQAHITQHFPGCCQMLQVSHIDIPVQLGRIPIPAPACPRADRLLLQGNLSVSDDRRGRKASLRGSREGR